VGEDRRTMTPPRLLVRDLMTAPVAVLNAQANVADVSDLIRSARIRHIPIVDEEGLMIGLVSHRDLLGKAFGGGEDLPTSIRRPYLRSIPVAEIMVTDLVTMAPDRLLRDAARLMHDGRHGCLPVVDAGRVVGILTSTDFVRHVAEG
jgi:CBS domain-containing membrane protein